MAEWWRHLTGKPFYWVLDGANPAADLFMLRHVVGRPESAPVTRRARLALVEDAAVEALKRCLAVEAGGEERYHGSFWSLRLLAELEVPGDDERVASALDRALDGAGRDGVKLPDVFADVILLQVAYAFGYGEDGRVRERLQRMQAHLQHGSFPATPLERTDLLTLSAMALARQPGGARDASTVASLGTSLRDLKPYDFARYRTFGFPVYDQPDGLVLARAALQLGLRGEWLRPWVEGIEGAQDAEGKWRLQRALPTCTPLWDEAEGGASRLLTAHALYVLREFYGE